MENRYHIAQFNIAWLSIPAADPVFNEFVSGIEKVNAVADNFPELSWTYQYTSVLGEPVAGFGEEPVVVNMSVWTSVDALKKFIYSGLHGEFYKKRKRWFKKTDKPAYVLWWVKPGHEPDIAEGREKWLALLNNGPSAAAFDFRQVYDPQDILQRV